MMLRYYVTTSVLSFALCIFSASVPNADEMRLDADGIFRKDNIAIHVGSTGAMTIACGDHVLGTWSCLPELEGALRCSSADNKELMEATRTVDIPRRLVVVEGKILTLDGKQHLTYVQRMQAADGGVWVEVSYALPGGGNAIGLMQNRRRPFGLKMLSGDDYAGAPARAVTRNGKEMRGSIPLEASANQANIVPQEAAVKSMTVWSTKTTMGIMVAPGPGVLVELLDFQRWGNHFRFNVHPDMDRTSFSETIILVDPLPIPPCSLSDVTLGPDEAYVLPCDRPAELKFQVSNNVDRNLDVTVKWTLEPWSRRVMLTGQQMVALKRSEKRVIPVFIRPPRRDLYRFTIRTEVNGKTTAGVRFPLASIVTLPRVRDLSTAIHFGFQGHIMSGVSRKWASSGCSRTSGGMRSNRRKGSLTGSLLTKSWHTANGSALHSCSRSTVRRSGLPACEG